ncbi:MAG: phosphoribosylformylglycinamidine cyclo-ligase [Candidatus Eremiobacteraeota bacterium]|nr:phosphoribosylformylglycinamidine cyclo-ligase [Candidatus Eremiobacteraeota bacterium]
MGEPHDVLRDAGPDLRPVERPDAYRHAGVSIAAGSEAVERYRAITKGRRHPSQLGELGGFSGLFALPGDASKALVASTDGVGTKVLVAVQLRRYDTVGADLVNHCVNDILVTSATPLFFLDYLALGRLDPDIAAAIVSGIERACADHDMALLGGETAEMPGVYQAEDFDLAGTIVGIVEVARIPNPENVQAGDAVIGLPAEGLHTNGYTLARRLIPPEAWGDALLAPHASYYHVVRNIERVADVRAMAHITGGGLLDNVARTLPAGCKAVLEQSRWAVPQIMHELILKGDLTHAERYRTFNMGIGYTLVVPLSDVPSVFEAAPQAQVIGWIEQRHGAEPPVVIHPAREAR